MLRSEIKLWVLGSTDQMNNSCCCKPDGDKDGDKLGKSENRKIRYTEKDHNNQVHQTNIYSEY